MNSKEGKCRLICPLTATSVAKMKADAALAAKAGADMAELRLDFLQPPPGEEELRDLVPSSPLPVIVTCRPERQGGHFSGTEENRLEILRTAAAMGAIVDIENDVPKDLRPKGSTILSYHDFEGTPENPAAIMSKLHGEYCDIGKIAFACDGPEKAVLALDVVRNAAGPTISLAMGESGVTSRVLAAKFGAYGTFASLDSKSESAPGQPTLAEMKELYRWDSISFNTQVFGVIGCPVGHSMSPAIHNAAFGEAGIDGVYLPLLIQPGRDHFFRFLDSVVDNPWLHWRGLSVTIPHKENALSYIGENNCDELAVRIGAVNTVTIETDGSLRGDNTDYGAATDALVNRMGIKRQDLAGRKIAVLGAGGASRAIVAALTHYGAEVTIYNRTFARAEKMAAEFECNAMPIDSAGELEAEIVINCTPLGMYPDVDTTPLPVIPSSVKVVFDTIYNPVETRLIRTAEEAECMTITGVDMFVNQAVAQFELWTGTSAPADVMRRVVLRHLDANA